MHDTQIPKVLTEADAAADLAGLPRPVSTDQSAQGVSSEGERLALTAALGYIDRHTPHLVSSEIRALVSERDALASRVRALEGLSERLKQEAQIHAQEARTANATIAEIYQCVTGATGEPGNWNGAEPVRQRLRELEGVALAYPGVLGALRVAWTYAANRIEDCKKSPSSSGWMVERASEDEWLIRDALATHTPYSLASKEQP